MILGVPLTSSGVPAIAGGMFLRLQRGYAFMCVSSFEEIEKMSRGLRDKIEYTMLCINKFAKAKELTAQQACSYLYDFKGLHFLDTAYPVESTLSSRIVVEDLHSVCKRNGGLLP